jgi:hypothetical protein
MQSPHNQAPAPRLRVWSKCQQSALNSKVPLRVVRRPLCTDTPVTRAFTAIVTAQRRLACCSASPKLASRTCRGSWVAWCVSATLPRPQLLPSHYLDTQQPAAGLSSELAPASASSSCWLSGSCLGDTRAPLLTTAATFLPCRRGSIPGKSTEHSDIDQSRDDIFRRHKSASRFQTP